MVWFLGQSFIFVVVAFLLGVLVGWLLWGRIRVTRRAPVSPAPPVSPAAPVSAAPPASPVPPVAPAQRQPEVRQTQPEVRQTQPEVRQTQPEVRQTQPEVRKAQPEVRQAQPVSPAVRQLDERAADDLQRIEGIGPKMEGALRGAGIRTYAQLAASDEATIRAAIAAARLRFAPSLPTWPRQAQLLADGDEAGFVALTRRLAGGRDTGRH